MEIDPVTREKREKGRYEGGRREMETDRVMGWGRGVKLYDVYILRTFHYLPTATYPASTKESPEQTTLPGPKRLKIVTR